LTRPSSTRYLAGEMSAFYRRILLSAGLLIVGAACLVLTSACSQKTGGETFLVSVDNAGNPGNGGSGKATISGDGRFVAFWSWAPNITSDSRGLAAPYAVLRKLALGQTSNIASDVGDSTATGVVSITPDGRSIAFASRDPGIVTDDVNQDSDVFVRRFDTIDIVRVSVNSAGEGANGGAFEPSISADGRYVAFSSYASNLAPGGDSGIMQVYVRDLVAGTTTRVSVDSGGNVANDSSWDPVISGNGRYVAFMSMATNLVDGDANDSCDLDADNFADDNCIDVFVHDRQTGKTTLASVLGDGMQGDGNSLFPSISADGRYVAFISAARNFLTGTQDAAWGFFVRDREDGTTARVGLQPRAGWMETGGGSADKAVGMGLWGPAISGDGKYVAFVRDWQVLVSSIDGSEAETVSVNRAGDEGDGSSSSPSISYDGQHVAFSSFANNLVPGVDGKSGAQVYLRVRSLGRRIIPNEGYAALVLSAATAAVVGAVSLRARRRDRRP
jgi:Tol biopolymer transport system component